MNRSTHVRPVKRAVTLEDREHILHALRGGASFHSVAKRTGRAKDTVANIAKAAGMNLASARTAAAAAARATFSETEQLEMIARLAGVLTALLDEPLSAATCNARRPRWAS